MSNEPVNCKTFGGVSFNWNEVKSANVKTVQGKKMYFIEFKSGVKVQYPEQNSGSMHSKELTMWQSLDYDTETFLKNVTDVKISGTPKDDHITGINITNSEIDVSGDNNDDHVDIVTKRMYYKDEDGVRSASDPNEESYGNRVILGNDDTATKTLKRETYKINDGKSVIEKEYKSIEGPGIDNRF